MLLANELDSIILLDGRIQALFSAAPDAFAIFEDLCLLGTRERPQFLQLDYLHKTFSLEVNESVFTNYHQPTLPQGVSLLSFTHPRLVCHELSSNHSHVHRISSSYSNYNTASSPAAQNPLRALRFLDCPPRHTCFFPSCLSNLPPCSERRPKPSSHHSSNSLVAKLTPVSLGLPWWMRVLVWRSCTGKAPLYTSHLAHWLIDNHAILYPYIRMQALWRCQVHVRCLAALQRLGNRR
jgi:Guanine nucleotide exchange factor in Golgi transport N-terminal